MSTISQRASDVNTRRPLGRPGMLYEGDHNVVRETVINSDPQAVEVWTITVSAATNGKTYEAVVDGVTISYTASGAATTSEIAAGLAAACNAEPLVGGRVRGSSASNVATFTGIEPGYEFTVSESDAQLSAANTANAAEADPVYFGRLVYADEVNSDGNLLGGTVNGAALDTRIDTVSVTFASGEEYTVEIEVEGYDPIIAGPVAADTNDANTAAAIRLAINNAAPADTVIAGGSGGDVTITAEIAGLNFETSAGSKSGSNITLANTSEDPNDVLAMIARGVSEYAYDEEILAVEGADAAYPANAGVRVLRRGKAVVAVDTSETAPSYRDPVYVETAAGATAGRFYTTASSTRLRVPGALWYMVDPSYPDLGVIAFDFTVAPYLNL